MKSSVKQLLSRIRRDAERRASCVVTRAMGRTRRFSGYDLGDDTFVFENGVWTDLDAHASVLLVEKAKLVHGTRGHVMTVTTGNHSVAALPLLQGHFWDLCRLPSQRRGDVMTYDVLCANVVDGKLEISQREVPCRRLVRLDAWLVQTLRFSMENVLMADRNVQTLEHYRALGQEWRVKPLVWTAREMSAAIAASRKRISTRLRYYHAARGVHFLSYSDFHDFAGWARSDYPAFCAALHELTAVFEGHSTSFLRQPKCFGHHEVEFFGMLRGAAHERLIPELETLMARIALGRISQDDAAAKIDELDALCKSLLTRAELADDASKAFVETLYMHLTGEIYSGMGEGATPAFDDRRTALPGATFLDGRPAFHPGADARTETLLTNIRGLMSEDEQVEYANVYELRTDDADAAEDETRRIGMGKTREIVYKTNQRPLVASMVEKRLSHTGTGYGSYVVSRAQAFKALGVSLPEYRLLRRRENGARRMYDYIVRARCEGEPLVDLPATYFQVAGEFGGADAGEDPQVVLALAFVMGDAAAQNMAMKKFDAATKTPIYGVGKEIYRFDYDVNAGRPMPQGVACCSIRGTLGWPDVSLTERNLSAIRDFYVGTYARHLAEYAEAHPCVPVVELAERFFAGFAFRTRAMEWQFTVRRDSFESFDPGLPTRFGFLPKWRFALWSLERQARRLDSFRQAFMGFVLHPDGEFRFDDIRELEDENAANVISALEDATVRFIEEEGEGE